MIPLVLALFLGVAQASAPVPRKASYGAVSAGLSITNNAQENKNPSAPPSSAIKPIAAPPQRGASNTPEAKNEGQSVTIGKLPSVSIDRNWADWVLWAFNGFLVLAGFLGIRVAYRTLLKISEQTEATKQAAEAAKISAEAAITENRPWLLIQDEQQPVLCLHGIENASQANTEMSWCSFFVKNYGRTPARILSEGVKLQVCASSTYPPDPDTYRENWVRDFPFMFPQGESRQIMAHLEPLGYITEEKIAEILRDKKQFLWLCGYIRYADTFQRQGAAVIYETRFCLLYDTVKYSLPYWREAGPAEYNQAK